jgi:hypothetical protein
VSATASIRRVGVAVTHHCARYAVEAPLGTRGSALGSPCAPSTVRLASVTPSLRMDAGHANRLLLQRVA